MDKSDYSDLLLKFDEFSQLVCENSEKYSILQEASLLKSEDLSEATKELNSLFKDRLKEIQFDDKIFQEVKNQTDGINELCNEIKASTIVIKLRYEVRETLLLILFISNYIYIYIYIYNYNYYYYYYYYYY
jgi:hypothetical protein